MYAIKAKINFSNMNVTNNDMFLSASTSSIVNLVNTSLSNLAATGKIISSVSSTIYLDAFNLSNITISD